MRLSVIVPAYDEATRIGNLLEQLVVALDGIPGSEVIVVDDGSTDGTADIARRRGCQVLEQVTNQGKAAAVRRGVAGSQGDHVAVLDADLEYLPGDLVELLSEADRAEEASRGAKPAVYGSRYRNPGNFRPGLAGRLRVLRGQELSSWAANWVLSVVAFCLFGRWLTDTLTGLKLYPGEWLRAQELRSVGFEGDHEITAKLIRSGIPIVEVPVAYRPRSRSEGKKIRPRDGLVAVATFVRHRLP